MVAKGVAGEIPIGRQNLTLGSIKFEEVPDIQAARWIRSHTKPDVIVASRDVALVYHYSGRRVIWFPPITNPNVLMRGLLEHHVQYLIIIDREFSYYIPPDATCFDLLYRAYPGMFHLVQMKGAMRIYEIS